jgi:hypothetical protein
MNASEVAPQVFKLGIAAASGAIAVTAAAAALGYDAETVDAVYHTPWARNQAKGHGFSGLNEAYEYGKSKWNDNDVQEAWPIEGADCSGFVGKVWATPAWTAIGTNYSYPGTRDWFNYAVDGTWELPMTDPGTRYMDAWVFRRSDNTGHMGVFEGSQDAGGKWKVWHAANEPSGIKYEYKPNSYFSDNGAKRFKRADW